MRYSILIIIAAFMVMPIVFGQRRGRREPLKVIQLSEPERSGKISLEETLAKRRSVRNFKNDKLTNKQLSQLAWAGQGITQEATGFRTAPSAGAIYPMKLYFATEEGLFVYDPKEHALRQVVREDVRGDLSKAALGQASVASAGCDIIIAGSARELAAKYRNKARDFALLEAGHIAQNILLQVTAMDLGAVPVGAFNTKHIRRICQFSPNMEPFYIIPVGQPVKENKQPENTDETK
jgi:SagB-type dehydrogenase family enzyme